MRKIPSVLQIGVGEWGIRHLRVWKRLENEGQCRLVGVQANNQERLHAIGKEFDIATFIDDSGWAEADVIDIVVPTYEHYNIAKRALLAGKDILVEKPFTETVEEAEDLKKISQKSRKIVMVGHLFRYNPAVLKVKELIETGDIGDIRFLRGQFIGFRDKESDTGILATTAMHFVYLANYFVGRFPKTVSARTEYLLDSDLDDRCLIHLDYVGVSATIESDYFTPGKRRTFDIVGTQGIIVLDALEQKVVIHKKSHVLEDGCFRAHDEGEISVDITFQEPLVLELQYFLDCVQERSEPCTGINDAISVLRIIEAGYKSSRSDNIVTIL